MAKLGYSVLNAANHVACTFPSNVSGCILWNTFAPFATSPVSSHRSLPIGSVLLLSPCLNCRDLVPDSSPPRELCAAYLWTSYVDTQNADHSARNSAAPERKTLWCPATVRLRVEILVRGSAFLQKRLSVSMSRSKPVLSSACWWRFVYVFYVVQSLGT